VSYSDKPPLDDVLLIHFGVKGMKWGVRKASNRAVDTLNVNNKGVTVRSDGSITIEKGASLQRLVRSNGKSMPLKDLTYASINEYDNARYVKIIGGKGFFGGGRDQILGITATKKITAPSVAEATKINSELMLKNETYRKKNTTIFGEPIGARELKQIENDPTGRTALAWYQMTNTKLTFSAEFDKNAPYVQQAFRETVVSKGYNAVRDENDVVSKIAKAPIIIFSPETSLRVTSVTQITDALRTANKDTLRAYKSLGRDWVDQQLYSDVPI
jgi:hypothetical protein